MIIKDKDRHAGSTKQKAAFVFPSEETPSCLWSEPLLKSGIAARVHHSPPERLYLSLRTNASSKTCSCVSPGARTDIQINKSTHTLAHAVLLLSRRNEEPVSCQPESSDASLVWIRSVCANTWKRCSLLWTVCHMMTSYITLWLIYWHLLVRKLTLRKLSKEN